MNCFRNNKWFYNLLLLFAGLNMTTTSNRFANEGEVFQLYCPYNKVNSWQLDGNEFLALCEHDKPMLNNDSFITHRMNISSDCTILTITNFTKEDAGKYVCFVTQKNNTNVYVKHAIYVTLRKLQIDEATDANFVQGTEGNNMSLTCSLQGGSANDILYWIKDNRTLKSGKPPSLKYTFVADQSDDMKEFKCRGSIMKMSYFLKKKVTVKLYLKPTVFISVLLNSSVSERDKNVIVKQGQHIELKCLEKYNGSGDVVIFSLLFNRILCKNNTNMLVLNKINTEMSGEYICRAHNRAGIYYDAVNITVADIPEMPRNFQVVALKLEIIVKWRAGNSGGMLQIFLIEYRNRFESEWNVITAEGKSSEVIDGLQMGTVYFVRMFSRNILGESNTTDEIIIKTGNQHFVIKSCSWEIGVLSSATVVVFFLCLCVVKATSKRFCLNMIQKRGNRSQSNTTTPETRRETQYDEIDSVYYNISNVNGRPELALNNTPIEALLSSINSRNIDNLTTDSVETGNIDHDSQIHSDNSTHNLTTDIVSATSSSDDSYLVPCRNYINLEIGFTNTHSHQITESEFVADGSSASNSESSETYIKSENQYETLATTNVVEHSYESTIKTY